MTPVEALNELLGRIRGTGNAFVSEHELIQWPSGAISAMKSQALLVKASPAASVICPGCEQDCTMPVETIPDSSGAAALFIVCDKRSDTNRVAISTEQLVQWQASVTAIVKFVARCLSLRLKGTRIGDGDMVEIGIVRYKNKSQMLCLHSGKELVLVAGTSRLALADAVVFAEGRYMLDAQTIEQLVSASTTADAHYTPSNARREARKLDTKARHKTWQKAYRKLKKRHPGASDNWCAIQISRMEIADGRRSETIRKNMK